MCMQITRLTRLRSANYPVLRRHDDATHHTPLKLMSWCMKRFPCPAFFARVSLCLWAFFPTVFFLPCEITHLDWRQMAQRAPKRALTPTSHLAAMPPLMLVSRKLSTSPDISFLPCDLSFCAFLTCFAYLRLSGSAVTLPWLCNLATTQTSPNLELIIHCGCLANCSVFVSIFECI